MKSDSIKFTILDDGACKMETDAISMPNHGNAEALLAGITRELGGKSEVKHKHGKQHTHTHAHGEEQHQH